MFILLTLLISYFIGSLSSAVLVAKMLGVPDPRTHGSNNPGATNMMRLGGKKAGGLTFLGDCLKGVLPALVFSHAFTAEFSLWYGTLAGAGAMLGHCFPIFMKFQGGKGVATYVGLLLAVSSKLLLVFAVVWVALTLITQYVSVASMLAAIAVSLAAWLLLGQGEVALVFACLCGLIVFRHRVNVVRLCAGNESKTNLLGKLRKD